MDIMVKYKADQSAYLYVFLTLKRSGFELLIDA